MYIIKCYDIYCTMYYNKMILLHSTGIESTRANIHINDRDECQSSEKNGMDLNGEGK